MYMKIASYVYIVYIKWQDLKTAYPKSVKNVKNMSKRRFLKPRLFKQKLKLKFRNEIMTTQRVGTPSEI